MKTKARDLIHGWPWPHSTSRPWPSTPTPLMEIQILNPPEIPAEVWTYLRLANDATNDLTGAPIKMWAGSYPGERTAAGIDRHIEFVMGPPPRREDIRRIREGEE